MSTKINLQTYLANKNLMDVNQPFTLIKRSGPIAMSWGCHAFTNLGNKALRFMVHGHHHTGHVYITLNGLDYYDVLLTTSKGTIIEEMNDISWDELVERIDVRIEKINSYQF